MLNFFFFKVNLKNERLYLYKTSKRKKMKNSNLKGALGALAVVGVGLLAKKAIDKKKAVRTILGDFGIQEKSPFGVADKIREMNDEQYQEFKTRMKTELQSKCCSGNACKC